MLRVDWEVKQQEAGGSKQTSRYKEDDICKVGDSGLQSVSYV